MKTSIKYLYLNHLTQKMTSNYPRREENRDRYEDILIKAILVNLYQVLRRILDLRRIYFHRNPLRPFQIEFLKIPWIVINPFSRQVPYHQRLKVILRKSPSLTSPQLQRLIKRPPHNFDHGSVILKRNKPRFVYTVNNRSNLVSLSAIFGIARNLTLLPLSQ